MNIGYDSVPEECFHFCLEQYQRFNIPMPEEIHEVIHIGGHATFSYVDYINPYALFYGTSDVNMTEEWSEYTYEIYDEYYKKTFEASPEGLETFRADLQQGEEVFIDILGKPGLEALPGGIGGEISDVINGGYYSDESCFDRCEPKTKEYLKALCSANGVIDHNRIEAYFNLAAWASYAWIIGPLSRRFRMDRHHVFAEVLQYGEAILSDGCVIPPANYRRLVRPPLSCHECGVTTWCIELVVVDGGTRYICEHCASEGMPPLGLATCGSRHCLLSNCQHHPMCGLGFQAASRKYGQLSNATKGLSDIRLPKKATG